MRIRLSSSLALSSVLLTGAAYGQAAGPRVTVETTPSGAKVYVDGRDKGIACQSGPSCKPRMTKGSHKLILELDGFKTLEETISVTGAAQRFAFTLQPAPARLEVKTLATNTGAQGGEIFVDGTLAGTVPATLDLAPGKHMIEVRRAGFQPYSESIEVKGGESRPLFIALNEKPGAAPTAGSIMVTSEVAGAEVIVDEQPRGPAPVKVDSLPPGDHVVEIRPREPHLQPWRRNVRVVAGQQAAAYATFTANPPPPPPADVPLFPVAFVPRSSSNAYVITTGGGASCTTPCNMPLATGTQEIAVTGPGSNHFRQFIDVPAGPSQVTVQHFTTGRLAGGIVMAVIGIPLLAVGSIYLVDPLTLPDALLPETRNQASIIGGAMAGVGGALMIGGIVLMSTTKTNSAEVRNLGGLQFGAAPAPSRM